MRTPFTRLSGRTLARVAGRALGATGLAAVALVISATPASAHGLNGTQPTDYQTRILKITPSIADTGIAVHVIDLGGRLQLINRSSSDVTILGYAGEPYLRVGPHGVDENVNSAAVYTNQSTNGLASIPKSVNTSAPPKWRHVSNDTTAQWHDHRAHWMGNGDPPVVSNQPGQSHVIIPTWTVQFEWHGTRYSVAGTVRWIPGPGALPWLVIALAAALILIALSRTRFAIPVITGALALLLVSEVLHVIGLWNASSTDSIGRLLVVVYSLGGILIAAIAILWMQRASVWNSMPIVLIAGVFLLISGGLVGVTVLDKSQLPTTMPYLLARLSVTLSLGLGAGLIVASGWRLRTPSEGEQVERRLARRRAITDS
jgi:hypothetical protein